MEPVTRSIQGHLGLLINLADLRKRYILSQSQKLFWEFMPSVRQELLESPWLGFNVAWHCFELEKSNRQLTINLVPH